MSTFNYNDLRINDGGPLSVDSWNGLIDQIEDLESTMKRVRLSDQDNGRIGIGTEPLRALHIKGNGGLNDDILLESITITRGVSGAFITERHRPNGQALKVNDLTGLLSFRGKNGNQTAGDSGIKGTYQGEKSAGKHQSSLTLFNTVNGSIKDLFVLHQDGYLKVNGPVKGNAAGGVLQIKTDYGDIKIGPSNKEYAHFSTDRSKFYFNKKLVISSGLLEAYNKSHLKLITSGATRLTVLGGSSANKGYIGIHTHTPKSRFHIKGNLTLEKNGSDRAYIIMRTYANNDGAKSMLNSLGKNESIIGGAWDDYFYFYWKNKSGKKRRAVIKGSSF